MEFDELYEKYGGKPPEKSPKHKKGRRLIISILILIVVVSTISIVIFLFWGSPKEVIDPRKAPLKIISFELNPPINRELLSYYGWTDGSIKKIFVKRGNTWEIQTSKGSLTVAPFDEDGYERFRNRSKILNYSFSDPVYYLNMSDGYLSYGWYQFCSPDYIIQGINVNVAELPIDALKKYDCAKNGDLNKISLNIPEPFIVNEGILDFLNDSYEFGIAVLDEEIEIMSRNKIATNMIELVEDLGDYLDFWYNFSKPKSQYTNITEEKNFKNGYYLAYNSSYTFVGLGYDFFITSIAVWYCPQNNITIYIRNPIETNIPENPLSYKGVENLSEFLC